MKQRALSENRARDDDVKLALNFLFRVFDKFDPNQTSLVTQTSRQCKQAICRQ